MTFGSEVKHLRKQKRLTLRELAEKVGVDFTYLSKIENDKTAPPSIDTIKLLAQQLDGDEFELMFLANRLPQELEHDLLDRPQSQVAEFYRTIKGREFSDVEWRQILKIIKEQSSPK